MALLAIQQQGATVRIKDQALIVEQGGKVLHCRPLHEIDELQLMGRVELAAAARSQLLRAGVDTCFLSLRGDFLGRLVGQQSRAAERRVAQYRTLQDPARCLTLARAVVGGKLRNQRALLQRVRRERPAVDLAACLAALRQSIRRVDEVDSIESLRGVEGSGAAMYFRGFGRAIAPADMAFSGRNRRPPRDPVNACLSFGYAVLLSRVMSAVARAGLDPCLGALHEPGRGKPALVLDLMEELRPLVVDRLVLRLVNRRQLGPADFVDPTADGAMLSVAPEQETTNAGSGGRNRPVYLGPIGRAVLLRELAGVWRTRSRRGEDDKRETLADLINGQARLLARVFEDRSPAYESLTLR